LGASSRAKTTPRTASRAGPLASIARSWHIWAPLLVLVILSAPVLTFMIPATKDYADEIYQPLQALKFFATRGHAFHKYGPMTNFVLAPFYGVSLLYWRLAGTLGKPSDTFPFGFAHPFEQMGMLILQGRIVCLLLAMAGFAYLGNTLRLVTHNRLAIALALLFCVATNYALLHAVPTPRPDSPMLAFTALALAVYLRMLYLGMTTRRAVAFALWATFAVSARELAAPLFVLPYLALIGLARRQGRSRALLWCLATTIVAYALLNVVYAPSTWWARMKFWTTGPGIDAEVWGGGSSGVGGRLAAVLACLLNNFAPGGAVVVLVALAAVFIKRPPRWVWLLLPAISVYLFGLSRIQYPADRFFTIVALALVPAVAAGLAEVRIDRAAFLAPIALLAVVNIGFATFAGIALGGTFEAQVERHVAAHLSKADTLNQLVTFPENPNSTRLNYLGYRNDYRSIQQIAAGDPRDFPRWIYTSEGKLKFVDESRTMPARAAMLKRESGFDATKWGGLEAMGYRLEQTIIPQTPRWFCFDWMPAVRQWKLRWEVRVYQRVDDSMNAPRLAGDRQSP
jgi:hypothetical protein